jgi:hypothetical protein
MMLYLLDLSFLWRNPTKRKCAGYGLEFSLFALNV